MKILGIPELKMSDITEELRKEISTNSLIILVLFEGIMVLIVLYKAFEIRIYIYDYILAYIIKLLILVII